jgi:hypothetical protein
MDSSVKSRDGYLFPDFSKKRQDETRQVMCSHGISRHLHGKFRTKEGLHRCK